MLTLWFGWSIRNFGPEVTFLGNTSIASESARRGDWAEAERYFPDFLGKVEALIAKHDLGDLDLHLRMTGCPNGCARPYLAEIGLVGKGPGRYNLMLGGDGRGTRLNKLYRENQSEAQILETLDDLLGRYARERTGDEKLGDFVIRAALVRPVINAARDFHD